MFSLYWKMVVGRFRRAEAELAEEPKRLFKEQWILGQQVNCESHGRTMPRALSPSYVTHQGAGYISDSTRIGRDHD